MARIYKAAGPSANKVIAPVKEKKAGKRGQMPPPPSENEEKKAEGGGEQRAALHG